MALARDAEGTVPALAMERAWPEPEQRTRCLAGLVADGLLVPNGRRLRAAGLIVLRAGEASGPHRAATESARSLTVRRCCARESSGWSSWSPMNAASTRLAA